MIYRFIFNSFENMMKQNFLIFVHLIILWLLICILLFYVHLQSFDGGSNEKIHFIFPYQNEQLWESEEFWFVVFHFEFCFITNNLPQFRSLLLDKFCFVEINRCSFFEADAWLNRIVYLLILFWFLIALINLVFLWDFWRSLLGIFHGNSFEVYIIKYKMYIKHCQSSLSSSSTS